eukprot:TRINITY_DN5288_c0_g1_i1.p1 TRINITY_DN5288_c0_g1~~TRINITY_DN5288_c0_g1_i1.p1  ORF type:complete len:224 (+),score=59.70 TRINITY_DN5288_c0_g1_i1:45-674(+)
MDSRGMRRTWSVVRSDAQFAALSDAISAARAALASPDLYAFLAAPPDVVEEPVLIGEVVDEDSWTERRVRSADPDAGRDPGRQSASLAGAVIGAVLGGPVGAVIGAVATPGLAQREDTLGEIAKTAGRATEDILDRAKEVDKEFDVRGRVKRGARVAYSAAREIDKSLGLTRKAGAAFGKLGAALRSVVDESDEDDDGDDHASSQKRQR